MSQTLRSLAEKLGCHLLGEPSVTVSRVASLQSATSGTLVFVEDAQHLDVALQSEADAIIAGDFAAANFDASASKSLLISSHPRLTFARAAKFLRSPQRTPTIHPSAVVAESARIAHTVSIGPRAVVGENVRIEDETTIGPGAVIGDNVTIGTHCRIDSNVTIYPAVHLGNRVVIQAGAVLGSEGFGYVRDAQTGRYEQSPQIGRLILEDDVEIGANSTIDRGALDETRIRQGTKIDNLVHIGHHRRQRRHGRTSRHRRPRPSRSRRHDRRPRRHPAQENFARKWRCLLGNACQARKRVFKGISVPLQISKQATLSSRIAPWRRSVPGLLDRKSLSARVS